MNEKTQCCGNCQNFSQLRYTGRDAWGDCTIEIPPCLEGPKQMVRRNHGENCPCWQKQVGGDGDEVISVARKDMGS